VYWKGFEPSELLDYKSRFVASRQELPFQEGKHLSPITEGDSSTELLEYTLTANNSPVRQVYMASLHNAEDDELGSKYDDDKSWTSLLTSPQLTPPRTRTRSTRGSDG
jgi:hypothetical protein